jgi:site-specific recombinase XerD
MQNTNPSLQISPCFEKYRQYLVSKELRQSTVSEHIYGARRFIQWATQSGRSGIEYMTYTELLEYVQHLKERQVQPQSINIQLNNIRQYYEFLKSEGICETNPAKRLHIKGTIKKVVVNPLSYSELEKLYHDYAAYADAKPTYNRLHRASILRGKVLLSLMIWQGMHSGELQKLRSEHIQLSKGVLDIPGAARSNGRTLPLAPAQILLLHGYLQTIESAQQKLFDGKNVNNNLQLLIKEIRGVNPVVKNAGHIRASVILHWMKIYDKRKVQHMIGHKRIGSTEKYEVQQLDTLTDQLQRFHPFA